MRHGLLTLLALLGSTSVAWAQIQFFTPPGSQTSVKVSADEVVARLMTFDQNNDGRIGLGELSERMRPLVARGDKDGDEALGQDEVRALAVAPVVQAGRLFTASGGYSFGDEAGLSSKKHIEGALEDLRLTSDKEDRALPIVRSYIEQVENAAREDLLSQMKTLLSPQQFAAFTRALEIQQRQIALRSNTGEMAFRLAVGVGDVGRRLDGMALGSPNNERARAALDEFKTRIRLGRETDRSELLAQLKDVLSDEELDNYGAALRRRPVVASSVTFAMQMNDVVTAIRERSGGTVPAVLIERLAPGGVIAR